MEELPISYSAALTLLLLLLITSIVWLFKSSKSETPPLPPGPHGLPILGYLPFLDLNLHHQFARLALKHGPIYKLRLGSKLCVVLSSPPLIKQVVRDHDSVFANRDPPAAAIAAHGGLDVFWSPNGAYWRDMRKLFVREMLSSKNLAASQALRIVQVRRLVRDVSGKIGERIGIGEMIFLTEVHVIMSLLWGGKIEGDERERLGTEFREMVSRFVDLLGKPNVSDYFPVLARFDLQGIEKEMREVMPGIEQILDSLINDRMKMMIDGEEEEEEEGRKKDFLEILLELKDHKVGEESSFGWTQIKAVLLDVVVGGTDTTATVVEWVMAELLNNPDVMGKVQQELSDIVGSNNIVEESHLSDLRYLEAVVKETYRVHPPLPLIVPRVPTQSTIIGGYTVPKGSNVFLNMWSIYRDPQLWDNPSQFDPDRFLNGSEDVDYYGNNFKYLPFGSGRRVCPGIPLGETMAMYLLATLLHSFDWRLPEGQTTVDLSETFGIVMRKTTPLFAVPYQRLSDLELYA